MEMEMEMGLEGKTLRMLVLKVKVKLKCWAQLLCLICSRKLLDRAGRPFR